MTNRENGFKVHFNLKKMTYIEAAVLEKIGRIPKIKKIKIPKLNEGQALIKIKYSAICKSQLMEIFGGRNNKKWLPHLMGHEATGEVVKLGKSVKKIKVGDKVILSWIASTGLECKKIRYEEDNKAINAGKVTTFCNYSIVSENRLVKLPKSQNLFNGVFLGCSFSTGMGMVLNQTKNINKKNSVAIIGFGGIGLGTLIALKHKKLKNILIIDKNKKKSYLAKKFKIRNFSTKINKNLLNKFDYCFESSGTREGIQNGLKLINSKGTVVFASHPNFKDKITIDPHELIKGKKIIGSWGGETKPDYDFKKYSSIMEEQKINMRKIIKKIYTLKEIRFAISDFKKNLVFRPIIKMEH